ncbi:MAG TPA: PKD domain-containing protein [Thermoplasmata archaeon]|nr:PKD domain-containing protein [Thermoplasmata archaeon]
MRPRRSPLAWGLSTLLILSTIGFLGFTVHLPSSPRPTAESGAITGPSGSPLAAATASLAAGHGPAAGAAVSCAQVAPNAASCSAHPAASFPANASWVNLTARAIPAPGARAGAEMVYDAADGYVLLFGGEFSGSAPFTFGVDRDTWTFSNGVWTNISSTVSGGPPPNAIAPAMAYDPWDQEVVLFGGANNTRGFPSGFQSQTWTYHGKVWTNITASAGTPPRGRILPSMVADTTDHRMILYGGTNQTTRFNDTWLFSAGTWSNITGSSGPLPKNLAYAFLSDDPPDQGVVLIGVNFVARPYMSNTWIYSGGTWSNVTATASLSSPSPFAPIMTYSPQTGAVVLSDSLEFNPSSGGSITFPITWVFFGGVWRNVTGQTGAPSDAALGAITTAPDGSVLAFSGTPTGTSSVENWFYGFSLPPAIATRVASPATAVTDVQRTVSVAVTPANGIGPSKLNLSWGDGSYSAGAATTTHAYATAGTFTINATITDFAGRTHYGATSVVVHSALVAPVITFTPHAPKSGQNVTFNASATGGSPTYTFNWTFPAAGTAMGASASHAFPSAGSYSVSVEATDAAGATTNASVTVNVTAPPATFSLSSGTGLYVLLGVIALLVVVGIVLVAMRMRRGRTPPPPLTPSPPLAGTAPPPPSPPPPGAT